MSADENKEQQKTGVNQSLLGAFMSLATQLKCDVDRDTLSNALVRSTTADPWEVISTVDGQIVVSDEGDYGSFPPSNDAIIKFQFQDQAAPYIEVDGERKANIVDHYCLVSHHGERLILDSDGLVKNTHIYGLPVSWASYEVVDDVLDEPPEPIEPGSTYKVLKGGENGWMIARKLGISGGVLRDHVQADVEDFSSIPEGTVLHLPFAQEPPVTEPTPEFEFLPNSIPMHVVKAGGTHKYTFGNAKTLADIKETGAIQQDNKNVNIFAIAHVPVDDQVVEYYMEASDVDPATQKVRWTVGFAEDDLDDGHVEQPKIRPEIQAQLDAKMAEAEARRAMIEDVNAEDNPPSKRMDSDSLPAEEPPALAPLVPLTADSGNPNWWKTTYKPLNEQRLPGVYLFNQNIVVTDLAGQCKNKLLRRLDGVRIAGMFTGPDERTYWRPQDAMDMFTWYGIPVLDPETGEQVLTPEAEVFNTHLPLAERASLRHGHLTFVERYFTVPLARATARSKWLSARAKKINKV